MKKIKIISLFVLLFLCFSFAQCKKNKSSNPLDQLPPPTETGANTFGCLVNGKAFLPGGSALGGGGTQANYQFVNGGYYVIASGTNNGNDLTSVHLFTDSLKIASGQSYNLKLRVKGNASANYNFLVPAGAENEYNTDNGSFATGELKINKLDTVNQIMSGTFYFNAIDQQGDSIKITDGRFDLRYTR